MVTFKWSLFVSSISQKIRLDNYGDFSNLVHVKIRSFLSLETRPSKRGFCLYFHGKLVLISLDGAVSKSTLFFTGFLLESGPLWRHFTIILTRCTWQNHFQRFSLISRDIVFQQLKNLTNFGSVALFTFWMTDRFLLQISRLWIQIL